jgi:hypothetical protein
VFSCAYALYQRSTVNKVEVRCGGEAGKEEAASPAGGLSISKEVQVQPDIQNVETPDWIAGGSALVLFISLFLPWVHVKFGGGLLGTNVSANSGPSFGWISILSVLAVLAIFVVVLLDVELPFPSGLVYLGAGGLSVLFTALVMLLRPIGTGGLSISGLSKVPWYGAIIGLIAGIGIVVAGFMKFQEQRY